MENTVLPYIFLAKPGAAGKTDTSFNDRTDRHSGFRITIHAGDRPANPRRQRLLHDSAVQHVGQGNRRSAAKGTRAVGRPGERVRTGCAAPGQTHFRIRRADARDLLRSANHGALPRREGRAGAEARIWQGDTAHQGHLVSIVRDASFEAASLELAWG